MHTSLFSICCSWCCCFEHPHGSHSLLLHVCISTVYVWVSVNISPQYLDNTFLFYIHLRTILCFMCNTILVAFIEKRLILWKKYIFFYILWWQKKTVFAPWTFFNLLMWPTDWVRTRVSSTPQHCFSPVTSGTYSASLQVLESSFENTDNSWVMIRNIPAGRNLTNRIGQNVPEKQQFALLFLLLSLQPSDFPSLPGPP